MGAVINAIINQVPQGTAKYAIIAVVVVAVIYGLIIVSVIYNVMSCLCNPWIKTAKWAARRRNKRKVFPATANDLNL